MGYGVLGKVWGVAYGPPLFRGSGVGGLQRGFGVQDLSCVMVTDWV